MSAARSAPTAVATSDSTARRAPSRHCLCPPPCAVQRAAPSRRLPRNPCSTGHGGRRQGSLATSGGRSARFGRQSRRPQPVASGGTGQSKSNACWPFSRRMTTIRPTPVLPPPALPASLRARAKRLLFFDPTADGVARHAESARQPTQTAALLVAAQNSFALRGTVSIAARLLTAAAATVAAHVALPTIRSQAVPHQFRTVAVLALHGNCDHALTLTCHL